MGEVHIQSQQEPIVAISPTPLMVNGCCSSGGCGGSVDHHIHTQNIQKQEQPILQNPPTTTMDDQSQEQDHSMEEPTDLFSMLRLNSFNNRQPPCSPAAANSNSMKRRSPSSSSSGEPSAKKLFCDQEDLTLHGFSAISLPLSLGTFANKTPSSSCPVLRRCSSDPHKPPADSPEQATPPRGGGLPPLHPIFRRSASDVTPDSMRLKRMKERLREMRQWWDEVMKDEEEKEDEQSQDELGGDSEEAVSVEWADKCVSLTFKCPCGKGYEVLLSENNCYYKLV